MKRTRKAVIAVAFPILLAMLLIAMSGCMGTSQGADDEYQKGYDDGVKSEQAKWSDQKLQLAKTMIQEQEDSQENMDRLLNGEVASVTVGEVSVEGDSAQVKIAANFKDGTVVDGTVDLVRIENMWYMEKVTSEKGSTSS
jgi:ABC-type Na+ efflux pump permease subunit